MRQQIEIIVVASVDVDKWVISQGSCETQLKNAVMRVVSEQTGTPYTDIETELEYGDPV